jgi:hypothetical protein
MQQAQQREVPERISWARAIIFGVGFFFLAAMLLGQIPGYIYYQMTTSIISFEQGLLGLGIACLAGFAVVQVIVLLFDPKPVVPPILFSGLGTILTIGGLALTIWASLGNLTFPKATTNIAPLLGGNFLWFEPGDINWDMIGLGILFVGVAMVFYSILAIREQRDPDRSDRGTTPAIRGMIIASIMLLILFIVFYTLVNDQGLAYLLNPAQVNQTFKINAQNPPISATQLIIDTILECVLGLSIFLALGALALRLHYLMRPVRKRTMAPLYAVGALGLAQTGAILLVLWVVMYPLITWVYNWSFIGLGGYLTICSKATAIPQSCFWSPQAGYIIDAIVTMNGFALLMAAIYFWNKKRNLVVIGSIVTVAIIGLATVLIHANSGEILIALLLAGGMIILASIWTSVASREFAVVGENNLGCLGMWLVVGTCLLIYISAFAFFSLPVFSNETEPNITFTSGTIVSSYGGPTAPPSPGQPDAVVTLIVLGILAAIQFYFLIRNRYKV